MYPANRTLNRQIQQSLYRLKREYGGTIDVYKLVSSTTDVRTGNKVVSKTVTHIDRAVVLPSTLKREVKQGISLISANKSLVAPASGYDVGVRDFIVDRRDAPDLPDLTPEDWLVYDLKKYQIVSFEDFEFGAGWVITARALIGEVPEQIHLLAADNLLDVQIGVALS